MLIKIGNMINLILVYTGWVVGLWKGILRRNILRKGKGFLKKGILINAVKKGHCGRALWKGNSERALWKGRKGTVHKLEFILPCIRDIPTIFTAIRENKES